MAAAERLKEGAADNDLIDRIRTDPAFPALDFDGMLDPSHFILASIDHQLPSENPSSIPSRAESSRRRSSIGHS